MREERLKHDTTLFFEIAKDICEASVEPTDIASIVRLGEKKKPEEGVDPRPIRIIFKSAEPKKSLFKNLSKLAASDREDLKAIIIDHDQTIAQREEYKKFLDKSKSMEADKGEDYPFVFRVRGPPWDRRIKRIKKKPIE